MKLLRLGSTGPDVERWEHFLRGFVKDSLIVVDGVFDKLTEDETKHFQYRSGFSGETIDGIVGPKTLAAAMKLGFDPDIEDDRESEGPNWPKKPSGVVVPSLAERQELFGKFEYKPAPTKGNPEGIKITDNWQKENLSKVCIPQLIGVKGAPKSGEIFIHTKLVDQTVAMFVAWEETGLKDKILTWGGSWVPRYIRGSRTTLSNHSWATAFDINVAWNGLGRVPALKGQKGSVRELVEIAVDYGYSWGGWYPTRRDGMHFEAYKIVK